MRTGTLTVPLAPVVQTFEWPRPRRTACKTSQHRRSARDALRRGDFETANLRRAVKACLQPDRAQDYSKLRQTIQWVLLL